MGRPTTDELKEQVEGGVDGSRTIMAVDPRCGHAIGAAVLPVKDKSWVADWASAGYELSTVETSWFRESATLCPPTCEMRGSDPPDPIG